MKFYNLMSIVLQSYIRNLFSVSHFNFDLFSSFTQNLLYLLDIFYSLRLILVHLCLKSRRTLSHYMQNMIKPFTTDTTHTKTKTCQVSNLHLLVFHTKTPTVVLLVNHKDTTASHLESLQIISISLIWKLYIPVLNNRHIPKQ